MIIIPKLTFLPKSATADIADVRLFGLVEGAVRVQDALLGEGLAAHVALVRALSRVLPPVNGQWAGGQIVQNRISDETVLTRMSISN